VVLLLIYWVVPDAKLFLYFTAALVAFVLVLTLAGVLLVYLAGRLRGRVGVAVALRSRELEPAARRERRAAGGLRHRRHGAAAAGDPA